MHFYSENLEFEQVITDYLFIYIWQVVWIFDWKKNCDSPCSFINLCNLITEEIKGKRENDYPDCRW